MSEKYLQLENEIKETTEKLTKLNKEYSLETISDKDVKSYINNMFNGAGYEKINTDKYGVRYHGN